MESKYGIYIALAFVGGGALGAAASYILTKNVCENRAHEAFEDLRKKYEVKATKKEEIKDAKEEKTEEEIVKIDKPSIQEMASIINSNNNSDITRTHYASVSNNKLKQTVRDIVEKDEEEDVEEKRTELSVIDYIRASAPEFESYNEFNFSYESDSETWSDWETGTVYDIEDLPFEPEDIIWDDNDKCYVADRGTKSLYILSKD